MAAGPAALQAKPDLYRGHESIPPRGPLAALTVPGAVGGWMLAMRPGLGAVALTLVIAISLVVQGAFRIGAALSARDVEYFHDHARIEQLFFDGALKPEGGMLKPDSSRPGLGLQLRTRDVERYRVYGNADSRRSSDAGRAPEPAWR